MPVRLGNDSIEIINPDKTYVVDTIKSTGERDGDTVLNVPVLSQEYYISQTTVSDYTVLDADATNLVAWYKFDGNGNDMLLDASGNNHTLINPSGTTPEYDNVIKVVGDGSLKLTNDYIDMPSTLNHYTIWNGNGISFSLWFKMPTSSPNYARIFTFCNNAVGTNPSNAIFVCRNQTTSNLLFRIMISGSSTNYIAVGSFVDDNWHHLVWSIDTSGVWSVYIDNVYINPNTTKTPSNFTPTRRYIGRSGYPVDTTYSTLNMDDFRIYDKVLTPTEIGYLANNMIKLEPQPIPDTPDYKVLTFTYQEPTHYIQMAENTTGFAGWSHIKHLHKNATQWYPENTEEGRDFFTVADQIFDSHGSFTKPFPDEFDELLFTRSDGDGNVDRFIHCSKSSIEGILANPEWNENIVSIKTQDGTLAQFRGFGTRSDYANRAPMLLSRNSFDSIQDYIVYEEHYQTSTTTEGNVWYAPVANKQYDVFARKSGTLFQTPYTLTFDNPTECDILMVGGGGAGSQAHGGGGGAGAVIFMKDVLMNGSYNIKIGNGGIAEGISGSGTTAIGNKGNDTEIFKTNTNKVIAEGGGGGGEISASGNGGNGGSGGGGDAYDNPSAGVKGLAIAYTPILEGITGIKYGNDGGDAYGDPGSGGSGGGAGAVGGDGLTRYPAEGSSGPGGIGIFKATINSIDYNFKTHFDISDTNIGDHDTGNVYFGGGGGAGTWGGSSIGALGGIGGGGNGGAGNLGGITQDEGSPGKPNTGGGGGGGGDHQPIGGNGGSGIVIIRYKQQYNQVPFNAQWTYSAADTSVHHYGNVGIGTAASDTKKLTVRGDVNVIGDYYKNNETFGQWYKNSISGVSIYRHSGNVGVGTSNPGYSLDVMGEVYASEGGISGNGSTSWITTSDSRIKENIVRASYKECYEIFKKINLYRYNYNGEYIDTNDKNQLGFIAQEVQTYLPHSVQERKMKFKNGVYIDDTLTLNVTEINYVMFGAFKYLMGELEIIKKYLPEPIVQDTVVDTNTETDNDTIEDTTIETNTDTIQDTTIETNTDTIQDTTIETNTDTIEDTTLETNTDTI